MKLSLQMFSLPSIEDWVALAQKAEAAGLAEIHLAERLDYPAPTWPTLFAMAEHTERIGLGPSVTNPYSRHPALTAKMTAMLDRYSHGRAVLGMGQGFFWQFDQLGIAHDLPLQSLREGVQVVRRFLSGDQAAFAGEIFSVPEGFTFPWQSYGDDVPIFVASRSPGGMAVAGEVADELFLANCVAAEFIELAQQQLRIGIKKAGRDRQLIPVGSAPQLGISRDRTAAVQFAQEWIGLFAGWMDVPRRLLGIEQEETARLSQAYSDGDREYLHNNVPPRYLEAFAVAGTPKDVIEQLERLADLGFDHIALHEPGPNLDEALELLGSEVVPHFA